MPKTTVVTLSELIFISLVWNACQNAWKIVTVDGLNQVVKITFPVLDRFYQNTIVGILLMGALYATILLAENVEIGRIKIFELKD